MSTKLLWGHTLCRCPFPLSWCVLTEIVFLEASTNSQPQDPNVTFLKNVGESVAAFLSPLGK